MYFFLVVFLLALVVLINFYSKRNPINKDKITHSRELNKDLVEIDEVFNVVCNIENHSAIALGKAYLTQTMNKEINLVNSDGKKQTVLGEEKSFTLRVVIKPNKSNKIVTPVFATRRGVYCFDKFNLESFDFLGLNIFKYQKNVKNQVIVAPKRVDNKFLNKMVAQGFGELNVKRGFALDETAIRTYGEYTGHEPMRHINWKKTAVLGDFVVKKFEPMGTHVTNVVFDINGFVGLEKGSKEYKLTEYAISILREIFEYFENKRIPYHLYTNASSEYIKDHEFVSHSLGKASREKMLKMLGTLNTDDNTSIISSRKLIDLALKNCAKLPIALIAPKNQSTITASVKKLSKVKGVEIIEFYADKIKNQF